MVCVSCEILHLFVDWPLLIICLYYFNCYNFHVCSRSGVGECTCVWRVSEGRRLMNQRVVGVLIGVMKKEEIYIPLIAVGWKLGAGRLDKCLGYSCSPELSRNFSSLLQITI